MANTADRHAAANPAGHFAYNLEDWYDDGFTPPAPVGTYAPNPFGLHDVHGNVWECCRDDHDGSFYEVSPKNDPVFYRAGAQIVVRGGSCRDKASDARSALRVNLAPSRMLGYHGVRPARALDP